MLVLFKEIFSHINDSIYLRFSSSYSASLGVGHAGLVVIDDDERTARLQASSVSTISLLSEQIVEVGHVNDFEEDDDQSEDGTNSGM